MRGRARLMRPPHASAAKCTVGAGAIWFLPLFSLATKRPCIRGLIIDYADLCPLSRHEQHKSGPFLPAASCQECPFVSYSSWRSHLFGADSTPYRIETTG